MGTCIQGGNGTRTSRRAARVGPPRMEFYAECTARTLFPLQVLEESEEIKQALRERDDDKVRELLDNFA